MEHTIDPEQFVGMHGTVMPLDNDVFYHEFEGRCIGVRHGFLQMRDQDDEVYEVEVRQFTPNVKDHLPIGEVSASNPESNSAAPIG